MKYNPMQKSSIDLLPKIKITDFDHHAPTKASIARVYCNRLALIAGYEHNLKHEDIYNEIAQFHIENYKIPIAFSSYDSFRKYYNANIKSIFNS
jgi:hypothetical protein